MTPSKLDRRDRRRARKVWKEIWRGNYIKPGVLTIIAAALKREREETSMAAVNWFLFKDRATTAKAKRAIAQKYCTRKHCSGRNCSRPRVSR